MGNYKFSASLYKNYKEHIGEINNSWIDKVIERHDGINEFNLTIPQYVNTDNGKVKTKIYDLIKSRQQVIVTNVDGIQERYLVCERKGKVSKSSANKQFTCYQFQKSLEKKRFKADASNYYFVKQPNLSDLDGIMDKWCGQTGWTLGEIDSALYHNDETVEERKIVAYNLSTVTNVQYDNKILDLDVNLSSSTTNYGQNPLYINIEYENVHTSEFNYNTVYNDFDVPFYTGIKNIKAYYYSEAGNRYGIKYVFTLQDNETETVVKTFENVTGKDLLWDSIKITYSTGNYVTQNTLKYPYFDAVDDNAYKFLQDVEDVFDCVFTFDTINKKINAYARATYGIEQGLELSLESNCLDVSDTEGEEIPTGIKVTGKTIDNAVVSIVSQNPFGGDVIYNYDYYINENILSDECISAWKKYVARLEIRQDQWNELQDKANDINNALITVESLITSLNLKITYTNDRLSACVKSNDTINQPTVSAELTNYQNQLKDALSKQASLQTQLDENTNAIQNFATGNLRENCVDENGNKIFTDEDLEILNDVDEILTVNDDYYTTSFSLYKYYKSYLADKVTPSKDFVINSANMNKYLEKNSSLINVGSLYPLDNVLTDFIGDSKVRLSEKEIIPKEDGSITVNKLTFTTKYKKTEKLNRVSNINRTVNKATAKIDSWTNIINNANVSNNYVSSVMKQGLDLAKNWANGYGESNLIDISNAGIYVTDIANKNNRIYIGSSAIAVTTTGFKTCETAVDAEGVIAKTVYGQLICGNRLKIESDDGLFEVGNFQNGALTNFALKFYDKEGNITTEKISIGIEEQLNGDKKAVFRLIGKDGQLCISEDGILSTDNWGSWDYLDNTHPMTAFFYVDDSVNEIINCKLRFKTDKFRSTSKAIGGGGSVISTTSQSGGDVTSFSNTQQSSESGGDHSHLMFGCTDTNAVNTPNASRAYLDQNGNAVYLPVDTNNPTALNLYTKGSSGNHSHLIQPHQHNMPSHVHGISLNLYHSHDIEIGVTEYTIASNVGVKINDILIGFGYNNDNELEIKSYVKKGWNTITFTSDTCGRIYYHMFLKTFNLF